MTGYTPGPRWALWGKLGPLFGAVPRRMRTGGEHVNWSRIIATAVTLTMALLVMAVILGVLP